MKKAAALILSLAMVFSLAACTSGNGTPSHRPDSADTRIFVDDCGRQVTLPSRITRLVPSGPLAQIVLLAIAPDLFVGLGDPLDDSARGILPDRLFDLPFFGQLYGSATLNVEELAATGPQIIIDIGQPVADTAEALDSLERQTTIPAVFVSASLETMPQTFRTLGSLLGREERGEELALFCERVFSRTTSILEKVGEEGKVRALYITGEDGLNVLAKTSYHAELMDLLTDNAAVVENPAGKGTGNEVTMEQLLLWDPDYIIFAPGSIYPSVADLPTWDSLSAISGGRYVEAPGVPHNWMGTPPSVQRYLGLIWLTAVLYPEHCDYDVKEEILTYYELFYGCVLTDGQYNTLTANAFLN